MFRVTILDSTGELATDWKSGEEESGVQASLILKHEETVPAAEIQLIINYKKMVNTKAIGIAESRRILLLNRRCVDSMSIKQIHLESAAVSLSLLHTRETGLTCWQTQFPEAHTFETQMVTRPEVQDPTAVLLPGKLRRLPNVEELVKKEELHVLVIKMKDVETRPCIGFKTSAPFGDQQHKVDLVSKMLRRDQHLFLLIQGPKGPWFTLIRVLAKSLQDPVIAPYAAFFRASSCLPVLEMNDDVPPSLPDLGIRTSMKIGFDVDRMDQYFLNYGSGIYGLDEADLGAHQRLIQAEFNVKLIDFPGAQNQKYICLIDLTELPLALREGDRFRIRFDRQLPSGLAGGLAPDFDERDSVDSEDIENVADMMESMIANFAKHEAATKGSQDVSETDGPKKKNDQFSGIRGTSNPFQNPHEWRGTITPNIPRHPEGWIAAIIYRPYDETNGCYRQFDKEEEPKPMSWRTIENPEFQKLFEIHAAQSAHISVWLDRAVTLRIVKSAGELVLNAKHKEELWKVIRNCGEETKQVDLYQHIKRTSEDDLHALDIVNRLNRQQLAVLRRMTKLPSMMVTVHGPPGCGKTYLESAIAMPLLQNPHMESGARQQCLFVCDTNRSADATAIRVQSMSNELIKRQDGSEVVVIRVFPDRVEDMIMKRSTKYFVPRHPHGNIQREGDGEDLLSELGAHFKDQLLKCESRATTTETGIPDRRVTDKTVSLAYRMLQRAGVIANGPWKNTNRMRFGNFSMYLGKYVRGELEENDELEFETEIAELRTATLESADVVVGTPYCVSQSSVYSAFKPVVMLIDEAARIMEPLLWLPLAWYTAPNNENLLAIIQIGDPCQTQPIITSLSKEDFLYHQLRTSMMARLDQSDSALEGLVEQYRMHPDIATVVSEAFYDRTLVTNPCTHHRSNKLARAMRVFNLKIFKKRTNLLAFDLQHTKQSCDGKGKSTSNPAHIVVTVDLVRLILRVVKDFLSGRDILILVPYRAQASLYQTALQEAHLKDRKLGFDNVKVDTIDCFQGGECPVVIFDLVVTDKIGFLQERGRLCTALSRAKCALYIIENFGAMERAVTQRYGDQRFCIELLRYFEDNSRVSRNTWAQGLADSFVG